MKITQTLANKYWKNLTEFKFNERIYLIKYQTTHCKGEIAIDTKYYNLVAKQLQKALDSVIVTSMEEMTKEHYKWLKGQEEFKICQ